VSVFNAVLPQGPKIPGIQFTFSEISEVHNFRLCPSLLLRDVASQWCSLYSEAVYITELTVPWENSTEEAYDLIDLGIRGQALRQTIRSVSEEATRYGSSRKTLAGPKEYQQDPLTNPHPTLENPGHNPPGGG